MADEIQKVYDRLARDKKTIKGYRNDIAFCYKESYDEFKGVKKEMIMNQRQKNY